ncbi:MAG: dihydrolipoyl dehydrogenase [Arenicella sp.]|nr:dihydrolipoyl dehydrogenase [Arenicella sp.]
MPAGGKRIVVIGAGPGGYTAAFRAADLGLDVTLVERYPSLGGVCLNVGCIPSKALLHSAAVISQAREMAAHGVTFGKPTIDVDKLRGFKESVISKLTGGLSGMAKSRKVTVVHGKAAFAGANTLTVNTADGDQAIEFDQAIIAAGSRVTVLPTFAIDDDRIIDSTGALELKDIPKSMLIVGGGIIGLEMATVYSELGCEVSIVEFMPDIITGADKDLVAPLRKRMNTLLKEIMTNTKVTELKPLKNGIEVHFENAKDGGALPAQTYDKVLIATGRQPNGDLINAQAAGVNVDERGFIAVDKQMRTNVSHIFAIGDIVGQPMLAHKATHEAKVAAEVCAGHKSAFEANVIPSVAYTDPELAWVGLTEIEAKKQGIEYDKAVFPWAASGRAIGNDRTEGKTKLLVDPKTERILGGGIVGTQAGDLISEVALAIEMGADVSDIALTIHPHPTLSESIAMAAEIQEGTITDLYMPKKK